MSSQSIVSRIAHQTFLHSPSTMPKGRWWEHLESNFAQRPEGFDLEPFDWIRVNTTAAIDSVVRGLGGSLLSLTLPLGFLPRIGGAGVDLTEGPDDWRVYQALVRSGRPESFFRPPPADVRVTEYEPRRAYFEPPSGSCTGLKFESPYEPFHHALRENFAAHTNNRIARARYWRHDDGPRPTIIAVHGFMADPYWINERFFSLPWFYENGCDVALFTLPHHGLRREPGSLYSGQGFFTSGMSGVNEHMGQAICDLRALIGYLRDEVGVPRIGVTGVSLGGWTAALLASVDDRIEFSVPNVPVVSPADLILEWPPAGQLLRLALFASPWSIKDLREILAATTSLTHDPKLPPERLMVIGGIGDRLAPPKHSRLLWDHWGRCRIHWFPGNHVLHLDRGEYLEQMLAFLHDIEFVRDAD